MTTFDEALQVVLRHEGGYVDHPEDPGGQTNLGITLGTLRRWRQQRGEPEPDDTDIRELTPQQAGEIYRSWYWDACQCDTLPPALRLPVFDAAVNQGPARAIRFLQSAAGATVDGIIGPQTRGAASAADPAELLRDFMAQRAQHYAGLNHVSTFGRGWYRRLFDVHSHAMKAL
ncbi:glycoside hydrolase family 108 protein [Thioalkalivibrio sp. ALJT]|uniref:glycoside hydrolase family 108 protein n=1 Tax=Thioalkalivibrio sp. ALJT TaxID=1158146 RepID=UPI0003773C0A|nr:glycosyl hydrolase 108 family protein [Thioalkalivibrio sp. ALJT]